MTRISVRKLRQLLPADELERLGLTAELKYHNEPIQVDGIRFASKREAERYQELRLLERAGQISGLVVHPEFPLEVDGELVGRYIADFAYYGEQGPVVEDVKSTPTKTAVYRLKKKLVQALYGIEIEDHQPDCRAARAALRTEEVAK